MSNHLINESSPYLLQHAHQPVDWYPWGDQAFELARSQDKPVFVSIGYSTCHWCHVMAEESFADPEVARSLNESFVSIKVDREERPDVDSVYMAVCQAMTGSGGWPLSVFMTPERQPFFAGTYFPKDEGRGPISFPRLLAAIAELWREDRPSLLKPASQLIDFLSRQSEPQGRLEPELLREGLSQFKSAFDSKYGGFGRAPKFPSAHNLLFLLDRYRKQGDSQALSMVELTLTNMYRGGQFDHVGFGFSRYSVDRAYQVPHFEKMLYDNGLLIMAYAQAAAVTGQGFYLRAAQEVADYISRELTGPEGQFYSAQDADSEGQEGRFYTFTPEETIKVLGEKDGAAFNACYGISEEGNFEGRSIPHLVGDEDQRKRLAPLLPKLREYRKGRSELLLDDLVLCGWNGLTIAALTRLFRVSGQSRYLDMALACHRFIDRHLREGDRLFASYRLDKRGSAGFLEDYGWLILAKLELAQVMPAPELLDQAELLCRRVLSDFSDQQRGGFYLNGISGEQLILRPKETFDGALPSGNSLLACALVRLAHLTEDPFWQEAAQAQLRFMCGAAAEAPMAHACFLLALSDWVEPPDRVTVAPAGDREVTSLLPELGVDDLVLPLIGPCRDYPLLEGRTTYYRCTNQACLPPSHNPRG